MDWFFIAYIDPEKTPESHKGLAKQLCNQESRPHLTLLTNARLLGVTHLCSPILCSSFARTQFPLAISFSAVRTVVSIVTARTGAHDTRSVGGRLVIVS